MLRRTFLLTPLALAGQPGRRRVALVLTPEKEVPAELAGESVVFGRAYTSCPEPAFARAVARSGMFAHALSAGSPDVIELLRGIGIEAAIADAPERGDAMLAFAGMWGDGEDTPFERSIRVPFAIRAPGLLLPRRADEILISTVDLAPTLLGLCGAAVPAAMQGRDLSALLLSKKADLPDSVFVQGGDWRALIRGYDKLVLNLNGDVTGLYNLADDPHETSNLTEETAAQLTRDALLALARVWMRRIGDGLDPSGLRKRA